MTSKRLSKSEYSLFAAGGISIFLVFWAILASSGFVNKLFLPPPLQVAESLKDLLIHGQLLSDIGSSLFRIILGFLISAAVAIPMGIALATSDRTEALIEPLLGFVRYIPPSAFIPLAILWFGIGENEKIFIIFLGVAPYLALLVADAVANTKKELIEAALTLGASSTSLITKVIIPYSMPAVWDAMRLMMGAAWTFVIIAEIVGATSGLGHLMIESQRFLRTDNIFASIVVVGFLGLLTDYFFKLTYKIFFPWTQKTTRSFIE